MKLYIWGTGCGAGDLVDRWFDPAEIEAFIDSQPSGASFLGRRVLRPEEVSADEETLILVASRQTDEIASLATACGIAPERLLFLKNNWQLRDRNAPYPSNTALPAGLLEELRRPPRKVRDPLWASGGPLSERDLENDTVRVRTLEALCRELDGVPGAAAELGVYRGAFARCINLLLPERTLYLFDTFSGFAKEEAASCTPGFAAAHENTAAERVLSLLPYPERAILRPGLFPGTAAGLEDERFCLVSLDVDLEESTLSGLRFFLPRLSPGGYLLLHDCLSPALPGVRAALRRYEQETGSRLHKVPLCDINGTVVISV